MASVKETKTKSGATRYRVRYRADHKSRESWFQRKTDADNFAAIVEADKLRGAWIDPALARTAFADWAEEWLGTKQHLKPKTLAGYRSLLNNQILPLFGVLELGRIRLNTVNNWLAALQEQELSASRIRQAHQVLDACLQAAVEDERIVKNPARLARKNLLRPRQREMLFLTHEEVDRLAGVVEEPWTIIYALAYSGARWGEMAGLRRRRCHILQRKLHIAESLSEVGGVLHHVSPKSDASERWVSIPKFLAERMAAHMLRSTASEPDALVFTSPNGGPLRHSNFRNRVWCPAVRRAGLPDSLRIRDLRHTAASFMIFEGAHLQIVRQQLGHSSVTVTEKYAHLYPSQVEELAERMDARFRLSSQPGVGLARG